MRHRPRIAITISACVSLLVLLTAHAATAQSADPLAAARSQLAAADYASAERSARDAVKAQPQSADAYFLLGSALMHESKATDSLAAFTEGARYRRPGAVELSTVASDYVLLKDYVDADKWFTESAKLDPSQPITWYLLGRTQFNENNWTAAEKSFEHCLQLDPHHIRAQYNLGLVYEQTERLTQALEAYRTAIAWQEAAGVKDPQPYLDLGMLLTKQDKVAEALDPLNKSVALDPRNPFAHQQLAIAYERTHDMPKAIEQMRAATALSPETESLHFLLGRMLRSSGDKEGAAKEFALAQQIAGGHSNAEVKNGDTPK